MLLALLAATATATAPFKAPSPPTGNYEYVAWCYGMLSQYMALHPVVMPEVTRIETTFRAPGSNLAADLKVYQDLQLAARRNRLKLELALSAAEGSGQADASRRGLAVARGRNAWPNLTTVGRRTMAQAWMSWTLPARCDKVADQLLDRTADLRRSAARPEGAVSVASAHPATYAPPTMPAAAPPPTTSAVKTQTSSTAAQSAANRSSAAVSSTTAPLSPLEMRCRAGNQSSCRVLARQRLRSGG